jgi:hypothetical protein
MPSKKVTKKKKIHSLSGKTVNFYSFSRAKKLLCASKRHVSTRRFNRLSLHRMRKLLNQDTQDINPRFFTLVSFEQCDKYFVSLIEGFTAWQDAGHVIRIEVVGEPSKRAENAEKIRCLLSDYGIYSVLNQDNKDNIVAGEPRTLFFVFKFNSSDALKSDNKVSPIKLKICQKRGRKNEHLTPLKSLRHFNESFLNQDKPFLNQTALLFLPEVVNRRNHSINHNENNVLNQTDHFSNDNGNNVTSVTTLIAGFSIVFGIGLFLFLVVYCVNRFLNRCNTAAESNDSGRSVNIPLNTQDIQRNSASLRLRT